MNIKTKGESLYYSNLFSLNQFSLLFKSKQDIKSQRKVASTIYHNFQVAFLNVQC